MIKKKLCKLITTGLIVTMFMGSVGTTVSAAEADTASTEIIMLSEDEESSREDSPAPDTAQESEQEQPAAVSGAEAVQAVDDSSEGAVNIGTDAAPEKDEELSEEVTDVTAQDNTDLQPEAEEETEDNEIVTDSAAAGDADTPDDPQDPSGSEEEDLTFTVTGLELDNADLKVDEKTTPEITAAVTVKTANTENIAERVADAFSWESSDDTVAVIAGVSAAVVPESGTDETESGENGSEAGESSSGETTGPVQCTVALTVKISALKEGAAVLSVSVGGWKAVCNVCVDPVPVPLAQCRNLLWKNVTVLYWDAVKGASSYRITTYLINNGKTYSKTISVNVTHYDLEDEITALIKANKASLKGASYTIRAAVWAKPSDTVHFKMGPGAKSYAFRYQYATYQEAVSRNGWFYKGGKWYLYENGAKLTGWVTFKSKRYYLDTDGTLKTNCWIGKRYVKSNGEMAKDEWVDEYQYYVDASGIRKDNVTFKTTNWIKNTKGWRYKTAAGFIKNQWKKIDHRMYYFDQYGYMKTGWLKEGNQKYYFKPIGDITAGRGVMQTGWVKSGSYYYWFNDDGSLATNKWVDRGQYYVNSAGRRLSHLNYMVLRNINTSNRLGYYIYSSGAAPEQSIAGYDISYSKGNRIMVIDLRFTKDNVPVCFHDDRVEYARTKNGKVPGTRPSVSKSTLKQLQEYDYGIKFGAKYKGIGPLTLEEMAKWVKAHSDTEVYIEVKVDSMSASQIKSTANILKKYNILDRSSVIFNVTKDSDTRAERMHKQSPTLRIGFTAGTVGGVASRHAKKCKGAKNEVFMYCWRTTKLSAAAVKLMKNMDVQFECGAFYDQAKTLPEVLDHLAKGTAYAYVSGVETQGELFHKLLRAATWHEKAHWVATAAGKKYMLLDGTYVRNRWFTLDGLTYRFDKNGIMLTGWFTKDGKRYYLNSRGERITGKRTVDGHMYLFDDDGVCRKRLT